ncbi:MAG: acyltransferase [Patescibacteria group bacterium]
MTILINNAFQATQIFIVIFVLVLLLTIRKKPILDGLSINVTQELKGFAILAIIFSHIGYFLVSDTRFLFPLSIAAGVGVNLFLILSGYGLTISALSKPLSIIQFYKHRLLKIYLPFWIIFLLFLGLDFFILGKVYSFDYIWQSLLGFFPSANSFDINSPFWYFTFIVAYYLLFPVVFLRKIPWLSAIILYLAGYFLFYQNPHFLNEVMRLYKVHILAFPLGVLIGSLVFKYKGSLVQARFNNIWQRVTKLKLLNIIGYCIFLLFLSGLVVYTAYYSNVGGTRLAEELTSILTCLALIALFSIKKIENRLFYWFGIFSYEIYLFHWPILSRFDIFYFWTPAWLATILYLTFFMAIAWTMRFLLNRIKS